MRERCEVSVKTKALVERADRRLCLAGDTALRGDFVGRKRFSFLGFQWVIRSIPAGFRPSFSSLRTAVVRIDGGLRAATRWQVRWI